MNALCKLIWLFSVMLIFSCRAADNSKTQLIKGSYGYDRDFLKKYNPSLIELHSADGQARILVSPEYQGRVMTSSAKGDTGLSFGWLNYNLISSNEKKSQFNPVGGGLACL